MATKVSIVRGATIKFTTTFFDVGGIVVQPDSATINIVYATPNNPAAVATVPMAPDISPTWSALWDTRGAVAPQLVTWSIHTGSSDPIPVSVEDGQFNLSANAANLITF